MDSNHSNRNFGIWVMAALLGLMLLIYFSSSGHQNKEQTVVKAQLEAVGEKRFTEAYYAYTSKEFQAATSLEDFKKFIYSFPILAQPHVIAFESTDDPGKVQVLLKVSQDLTKFLYTLHKEGNSWQVQRIEVVQESENRMEE